MARCSRLVIFFFKESSVFRRAGVGKSLEKYLLSKAFRRPCRKNYIFGYIRHKSFIQMVKWSFFSQITVYQSFYGALLTFRNFFLFRLRDVNSLRIWSVAKTLSKWYLWLYLTQPVHFNGKIIFPWRKNCWSKFLWGIALILLFLKVVYFGMCVPKSSMLGPCLLLSKKCYFSVVFATRRRDCWGAYPRFYLILSLVFVINILRQLIFC